MKYALNILGTIRFFKTYYNLLDRKNSLSQAIGVY